MFGERGYAPVSIAEIADEAGLSIPTIYASVGTKQSIVMALVELIDVQIGGAEGCPRIQTETDPDELLALAARVTRTLHERFGDIVAALQSAALVEPAVAEAVAKGVKTHRVATSALAARLHSIGALRAGMRIAEAADIIGFFTDSVRYSELVGRYG